MKSVRIKWNLKNPFKVMSGSSGLILGPAHVNCYFSLASIFGIVILLF